MDSQSPEFEPWEGEMYPELQEYHDRIMRNIRDRDAQTVHIDAESVQTQDLYAQSFRVALHKIAAEFGDTQSAVIATLLININPALEPLAESIKRDLLDEAFHGTSPHRSDFPPRSEEGRTHNEQHDGNEVRE